MKELTQSQELRISIEEIEDGDVKVTPTLPPGFVLTQHTDINTMEAVFRVKKL